MSIPHPETTPPKADLAGLKRQLRQLEELHATGTLTAQAFEEGRQTLERRILDCVLSDTGPELAPSVATGPTVAPVGVGASKRLWLGLAAAVLVVAVVGYGLVGRPNEGSAQDSVAEAGAASGGQDAKPHSTDFDQIAAMTDGLAAKLKDNPKDGPGWAMLARSYSVLGRNPEALDAYKKALALQGDDPVLLADYADALAVKSKGDLAGEPIKLVERALKKDPANIKALYLAGTHAFTLKDYAGATRHWEKAVQAGPSGNPMIAQIQSSLGEARRLAGLPDVGAQDKDAGTKITAGSTVSGTVTLDAALSKNAQPTDTVFIFARAAEGGRMPLAILRKQVKDLPIQFTLDDSMAMSPAGSLSKAGRVVIGARISKSGNAMPEKGDLSGASNSVPVGARDVAVVIKDLVKQ
ncbi:MAG: hypothetical protein RJA34_759 [Pseudomonadota bacterium]|jgi:cytochrome c-type biogenesis protein CcmH